MLGFKGKLAALLLAVSILLPVPAEADEQKQTPQSVNAEAQKAFESGEAAAEKNDQKAAIAHYTRAIEQDAAFAEAWFGRAWAHSDSDDSVPAMRSHFGAGDGRSSTGTS